MIYFLLLLVAILVILPFIPDDPKSDIHANDHAGYNEFGKPENYNSEK